MPETVGVIGLGEMGNPISRHWMEDGYDVHVYDVDDEKVQQLADLGATPADGLQDLAAACDVVLVIVGTDEQVIEVVAGENGVSEGLGDDDVVVVSSTVHPDVIGELDDALPDGAHIIDAPFGRGRYVEERGSVVYAGGDDAVFERVKPLLQSFGGEGVYHLGEPGSGEMAKAVNNMLLWACHTANYEALRLADAYGIDPDEMREAVAAGSGRNFALTHRWEKSTGKWAEDDLRIVSEMAERFGVELPQTEQTRGLMQAFGVSSRGMGSLYQLEEPPTLTVSQYHRGEESVEYPSVTEESLEGTEGYDL